MQKICPLLELTRLINTVGIFITQTQTHTQECKTIQRCKKFSRTTGGMVLITIFYLSKSDGARHGFEPSALRIAVLHLTKCAITTAYHRF